MERIRYYIIDKLFILFLICNILFLDTFLLNFNLRYVLLALAVLMSIPNLRISSNSLNFLIFSIFCACYLFLYGILKGNNPSNILSHLSPYLFLATIFPLECLMNQYGFDRYLKVILVLISILVVYFLALNIIFLQNRGLAFYLSEKHQLISLTYMPGDFFPRVVFKNFVLVLPLFFMIFLNNKSIILKLILFVIILFLIFLSGTYGFFIGLMFGIIIYFNNKFGTKVTMVAMLGILLVLYFNMSNIQNALGEANELKQGSISIKFQQVKNITKDMNTFELFMGRGIGSQFVAFDTRNMVDDMLEVSLVQAFQMGGFLTIFVILFIYSFHVIKYMAIQFTRKLNDMELFLLISQSCIFWSSLANPYIWSGGVGLLFVVLISVFDSKIYYKNA